MQKFSPLLVLIALGTPLFAQSTFDQKQTVDLVAVTRYCRNVDAGSASQAHRVFAKIASANEPSTGWMEFDSRAAWRRAGSPKPVALVWYRDAKIVRVAISPDNDESPRMFADYCYRQDGTLARLRSVPSESQNCEPSRGQCTYVLREVRFYPPEGPVLKAYGAAGDELLDLLSGTSTGFLEVRPAERVIHKFVPMNWPEYRNVRDLPFSELLYATLR